MFELQRVNLCFPVQIPQANLEEEEAAFLDQSWLYNKRLQALRAIDPSYRPNEYDYDTGVPYLSEDELAEKKVEVYFKNEQFQVRLNVKNSFGHFQITYFNPYLFILCFASVFFEAALFKLEYTVLFWLNILSSCAC